MSGALKIMTISCLGKSAMHFLVTRQLSPLVQSTQAPKNNSTQPIPKSNMSSLHFELPTSSLFLHLKILCRRARARITRSWAHITSHPLLHEHGKAHITSHLTSSSLKIGKAHITSHHLVALENGKARLCPGPGSHSIA